MKKVMQGLSHEFLPSGDFIFVGELTLMARASFIL